MSAMRNSVYRILKKCKGNLLSRNKAINKRIFLNLALQVNYILNIGECFFTDQKFMFKLKMSFNATLKSLNIDREGFGSYTLVGDKR